jgi:2-phosphinomethylmalic acid synthase
MYAPFDVPTLLGRPLEVSLTKDSGVAGLVFLVRQHLGLEIAKDDPQIRALHDEVEREFDSGRQTGMEWEELAPLVAKHGIGEKIEHGR